MTRNQNKSTSNEHPCIRVGISSDGIDLFSARLVPLGRGKRRRQRNGCRRREILKERDVRTVFCHQEFETKGTCDFRDRFLFVAIFTFVARRIAVGPNV